MIRKIMETNEMKPKNIFEQILFGQLAINDNIVVLSKNIEILNERFDDIMSVFSTNTIAVVEDTKPSVLND